MEESSTTINHSAVDVVSTVTELDPETMPRADIQVHWHNCDEAALRTIMATFPDARWAPQQNGTTEWITGHVGPVRLVAFAVDPEPQTVPRLAGLFSQVQA